jgi:RsmE family RNA methyltransferase
MNLILVEAEELNERGEVTLAGRRAEHILHVLKGQVGQSLRVGRVNGPTGTGMIKGVRGGTVAMRCIFNDRVPIEPRVDLLLAMPRPKAMKRLWLPLASLGLGRIFITNAQKVERYYFDSHVLETSFIQEQLREGLEQAMDTRLPEVEVHLQLKPLLEDRLGEACPNSIRLAADPSGTQKVSAALASLSPDARVLLAIGPEGGWSDYELEMLAQQDFSLVGMGPRILRTDTACVALLALVYDALRS